MAQRSATAQRKQSLLEDLRQEYLLNGDSRRETPLSQRELGARYQLSGQTVSKLLQQLMQEGVLYTVPRVGTFVGRAPLQKARPFIVATRHHRALNIFNDQISFGFEDRIAQLGGTCLTLTTDELRLLVERNGTAALSGIFLFDSPDFIIQDRMKYEVPIVTFGSDHEQQMLDTVDFDNEEGGAQAVRHLLSLGHRKIAFLALNSEQDQDKFFPWSAQREAGWRRMMQDAGLETKGLSFRPDSRPLDTNPLEFVEQTACARETSKSLIQVSEITAVVAANALAAEGLLQTLRASALPPEKWPAILCFDDVPSQAASAISYLRLPWEKIGAEGAQLLWERQTGRLSASPQQRLVKMHLIPRLSCHADWLGGENNLAHDRVVASPPLEASAMHQTLVSSRFSVS